jgi:hypothetical protein
MTPEIELVLCCARTQLDADAVARVRRLVEQGVNWAALCSAATDHNVMPLVCSHLRDSCSDLLPPGPLECIRDVVRRNARRNLYLLRELLEILELFERHGIRAIPFKGPVLAAQAYGDVALRSFLDLDILIQPNELERARSLLLSHGYHTDAAGNIPEQALLRYGYELSFRRDDGVLVELQWRLWPRYFSFELTCDTLRGRLRPISCGRRTLYGLSPEDSLLIVCAHGSKHCWGQLGDVCDVAELVERNPIDWDFLLLQARALGSLRMVLLGLALARDIRGASLPRVISRRLEAEHRGVSLVEGIRSGLFGNRDTQPIVVQSAAFHLRSRERLLDRLRYVARLGILPSVEDFKRFPLPVTLFPLQYVLRPFRLLARYGSRLLTVDAAVR